MRGRGEGTIYRRADGRWEAKVSLDGGRRRSLFGKTRQEVARKLAQALRDRELGLEPPSERQALGGYLESWLDLMKPPRTKPKTWRRYSELLRLHVMPDLGRVKLARLTPLQVPRLYSDRLAEGLSSTTVHHLHTVLHGALEAAVRLDLVARNVCDRVDAPKVLRHEMRALSEAEAQRLLEAAEGTRWAALYRLALATGMRQGELLGLRWSDVDLERGWLQVARTLHWIPGQGFVFSAPKTARSRRRISIREDIVEALRAHRRRQLAERMAFGEGWVDEDLVFPNMLGGPMDGGNLVYQCFLPLLKAAGLPRIRFHDLRHTAATLALGRRVPVKVVSEMLGHASTAITQDLYSHVLPDMQEAAAEEMQRALRRGG
jgi:integrase